jgi:thiol-disulfide isomerase/thioredoxin
MQMSFKSLLLLSLILPVTLALSSCRKKTDTQHSDPQPVDPHHVAAGSEADKSPGSDVLAAVDSSDIPRFAANSPFDSDYRSPLPKKDKMLWARSCLWEAAPQFVVEKWLTDEPDMKDKYRLIEFWATWCPPCRRSIAMLNSFHAKFKDELVVIGVSEETEADVRKLKEPVIEYYYAIDTRKRMKDALGVFGIPHVIIVEPGGSVVWEGFPFLTDYELTEQVVDGILDVGRQQKTAAAMK